MSAGSADTLGLRLGFVLGEGYELLEVDHAVVVRVHRLCAAPNRPTPSATLHDTG